MQGFWGAGLKALAGMAKHSALEPCSAGRTRRLHGRELSPSNTPGPWLLERWGRPVCLPAAWLRGWTGLPMGSTDPPHPGFGGCLCVPQSIPSSPMLCGTSSFRRLPNSLLPRCPLDAPSANCSCSDAFCVFFPLGPFPSPSIPPSPSLQEGSFATSPRIRVGRKHAVSGESSLRLPAAHVPCSSSVPARNIVAARAGQQTRGEGESGCLLEMASSLRLSQVQNKTASFSLN